MFSRGQELPPVGSIEDRVMREVVFRERVEKVAHVRAIASMIARVFNLDADRYFGSAVADYASEVFQEGYDPDLLQRKIERWRAARDSIRKRREQDQGMMRRLEKMSEFYEKEAKKNK